MTFQVHTQPETPAPSVAFTVTPPAAPGASSGFRQGEFENRLLLVVGPTLKTGIATQHGLADAAACAVVDLDTGDVHIDALLWGAVLVPQVCGGGAELVAGRLSKGEAMNGRSAPWKLADPTEADTVLASKWVESAAQGGVLRRDASGKIELVAPAEPTLRVNPPHVAPDQAPF